MLSKKNFIYLTVKEGSGHTSIDFSGAISLNELLPLVFCLIFVIKKQSKHIKQSKPTDLLFIMHCCSDTALLCCTRLHSSDLH